MRSNLLCLLCLVVVATGCSSFKSHKRMNLAPFAETTISLASDIEFGLTETSRSTNLRKYWKDPVLLEHRQEWEKVRVLLKGVVAYSVEITALGNSNLSGPERCEELASFLDPLARPVVLYERVRAHISEERMGEILEDIRAQKKLLDALAAAQPLIDEVARISDNIFDEVQESLDKTTLHVVGRIDAENTQVVKFAELVKRRQYEVFETILLLARYRTGDESALPLLWELDPQLKEHAKSDKKLTQEEIFAIEARLIKKSEFAYDIKELIAPDMVLYEAEQQAMADLYTDATHQLKRARVTMIIWARAHRNLASGITDPATIDLFSVTKKAIKTAL